MQVNINKGDRYGRLTIIAEAGKDKHKKRCVRCICDCGNITVVELNSIRTGNTQSCGCYGLEMSRKSNTTHGKTHSLLYNTWRGMKDRCLNKKACNYLNYGGRGIMLCQEWTEFEKFYEWAIISGYRSGLTIERKDVNGNYNPVNCRWATRLEQSNNRRSNCLICFNGETKSVTEWSKLMGINYGTLKSRLLTGWDTSRALLVPTGIIKTGPKTHKALNKS